MLSTVEACLDLSCCCSLFVFSRYWSDVCCNISNFPQYYTVLLVKLLLCRETHPALGNESISSWMCKKMLEQKTCFLQSLESTRQTTTFAFWKWLSARKSAQANAVFEQMFLLSAVWHTSLGISLFYDSYHTINNVLASDEKDKHCLERWEHVSWGCRAWLSRLFLMQYIMLHSKGLERGGRSWHC